MFNDKVETVKNFIEFQLEHLGISYETHLEEDDELGGYCYMVCSDHGAILFSDHTDDRSLTIYQINTKMLEWAEAEGLNDLQREKLNTYIYVNTVHEALDILTDNKFSL